MGSQGREAPEPTPPGSVDSPGQAAEIGGLEETCGAKPRWGVAGNPTGELSWQSGDWEPVCLCREPGQAVALLELMRVTLSLHGVPAGVAWRDGSKGAW